MFDEFKKSLKASLYERAASPIIGAFVSAWLIFNWKLCLVVAFADDSIYDRLAFIEKSPYIDIWLNLYFPAIAAAVFIALYPLASLLPYMWWEWYAKKKSEIKNSMQRGVLLSLEKSIELRNEIDNQEAKFEEMLKSKEQKNAELLVMHENLQKILEEKDRELEDLKRLNHELAKKKSQKDKVVTVKPEDTFPFHSTNGGFAKEIDAVRSAALNAGVNKAAPFPEKNIMEAAWDEEFKALDERNPNFRRLFDQAIEGAVTRNRGIDTEAKKISMVHGLMEQAPDGHLKMTEKGQYMAKKVL